MPSGPHLDLNWVHRIEKERVHAAITEIRGEDISGDRAGGSRFYSVVSEPNRTRMDEAHQAVDASHGVRAVPPSGEKVIANYYRQHYFPEIPEVAAKPLL